MDSLHIDLLSVIASRLSSALSVRAFLLTNKYVRCVRKDSETP
jgi:hypothetical protein